MKKFFLIILFLSSFAFSQNFNRWSYDYYGSGRTAFSDSLIIQPGKWISPEYHLSNQIAIIKVDQNWTTSLIGFQVWNPLIGSWETLRTSMGNVIKYTIAPSNPVAVVPSELYGVRRIRFVKINSSNSPVIQQTNPTTIAIEMVTY